MASEQRIDIPDESERQVYNECHITVGARGLHLWWDRPLPDEAHKPTRVEVMAAGALLGIARALTGNGEQAIVEAMSRVARAGKARRR